MRSPFTSSSRTVAFTRFFQTLPLGSKVAFYAAVFCCFAPIGLLTDVSSLGRTSVAGVLVTTIYSGVTALTYAYLGMSARVRWMPVVVAIQIGVSLALPRLMPLAAAPLALDHEAMIAVQTRLQTVSLLAIAFMAAAYGLFLTLFSREGRRFGGVQTEMRLAQEIHRTLVPALDGRSDGLEWLGRSEPSGQVGGDLVDVIHTDSGWWGIVADVTGHGVGAGLVMGMFKTALHAHVGTAESPGQLLERINRTLAPLRQPNMMVTVACLRRRSATEFEYALAGHPPMLHLSARGARSSWIGDSQYAIGLVDDATFRTDVVAVADSDMLLVLTDGLLEVFDRKDREIGPEGVLAAVKAAPAGAALDDVAARVFDACRRHGAQEDDQTLLLVRVA